MDRDRLEQVHQTDLTESRVNEDFLVWLKTKAPTYLLAVLLGLAGFLAVVKYREYKRQLVDSAWSDLQASRLAVSLEEVAAEHKSVRGVHLLAQLGAAEYHLRSVQTGLSDPLQNPNATDGATPEPLTAEQREAALANAARLYEAVKAEDDGSVGMTPFGATALYGLAAVAEARGNFDEARTRYAEAAKRVDVYDPRLGARAETRINTLTEQTSAITMPKLADLPPSVAAGATTPGAFDPTTLNLGSEYRVDPTLGRLINEPGS